MGAGILLVYIVVIIAVFYFLMIRPQRRRREAQRALIQAVKKGDEIVTSEGLFGTVRQVRDDFIVLEIADHKRVRLLRSSVAQVRGTAAPPARRS